MQDRVFANKKIEFLPNKNVTNLLGDGKLESVELTDSITKEISNLKLDGCFIAIGHTPNTKFLNNILETDEKGFLKVKNHTRSNIPSVFIAGDVADPRYQQAITAAGAGCMAALDAEKFLMEKR
jgi:thioredoxin reductase (NADPH)